MKKFIYAFLILATFGISSCSKDDNNETPKPTNYYNFGDEKIEIKWAGYSKNDQGDYQFAIAPKVPNNAIYLYEDDDYFVMDLPQEKLGQLNNLSDNLDGDSWGFYSILVHKGNYYEIKDQQSENDGDAVTGTNNWFKVVKESGDHTYTLEFEMTVDGKPFKGKYTGPFTKITDYIQWAW